MLELRTISFLLALAGFASADSERSPSHHVAPIFSTGVPNATKDKPQSKLWYAQGRWWAWLPVSGGSTILERTPSGWRELTHLRTRLSGLPGQADVLAERELVRAVLVGGPRLAAVDLTFNKSKGTYEVARPPHEWSFSAGTAPKSLIETATIVVDSKGACWVVFAREGSLWVAGTTDPDATRWGEPKPLGSGLKGDDIGEAFALGDRIGVLWSDQNADAVYFREHLDGQDPGRWGDRIAVAQGEKTADDHFNAAVAPDGTLFVATKNSADRIGSPQLVLRIRRPDGKWENHPYASRTEEWEPTRPVALLGGSPTRLFLLHTVYDRRKAKDRRDTIRLLRVSPDRLDELAGPDSLILSAATSINNVTGTRSVLPTDAPWIFLASDAKGNVYEGQIPR